MEYDEEYQGIIYNEQPLEESFPPTRLLHRDGQRDEIVRCLKPALKGRKINNLYLYGAPGTGKTALIKFILENEFPGMFAYVNCFKYSETKAVLREILWQFGVNLPESADVIKEFENFVKNKNIIVCLDEVDQLEDPDKLLYILADSVGLILISNQSYVNLYRLNQRTRDRLGLTEVEFPEYKPDELFDIGKDRVQFSFVPGTLPDQLIRIAAMMSLGDARVLLRTLRNAGRLAEERGKKKVTIDEIKEGAKEARKLRKSRALAKLNEHQKIIYNILDEKREMFSGDLYREYKARVSNPVGPRGFRKYMNKIVALGLAVAKGGKGRYRKYEITI